MLVFGRVVYQAINQFLQKIQSTLEIRSEQAEYSYHSFRGLDSSGLKMWVFVGFFVIQEDKSHSAGKCFWPFLNFSKFEVSMEVSN